MATVKTFKAKSIINLFDSKTQKKIEGVLFFSNSIKDIPIANTPIPKVTNRQWVENNYVSKKSKINLVNFKVLAVFFFLVSLVGFSSLALPVAFAEVNLRLNYIKQNLNITENQPQTQIPAQITSEAQPKSNQAEIDKYLVKKDVEPLPLNFSISIPKIGVTSEVIPNVDPSSPDDYNQKLMLGVGHAKGSYLPGQDGTIFLFAHSTDSPINILQYNAQFYAAKDLDFGDEIIIDYHGKTYKYVVESKLITEPNDLEVIRNSGADLILQTCWPPGTDWNRLLILAKEVK